MAALLPSFVAGVGLGSLLLILIAWDVLVEPRLVEMKEETAVIPGLPNEWNGKRVALIADLHIGMWWGNEETGRRIVERIIKEKPALVLIAGDFVYKPTDEDEPSEVERTAGPSSPSSPCAAGPIENRTASR